MTLAIRDLVVTIGGAAVGGVVLENATTSPWRPLMKTRLLSPGICASIEDG